MINNNFLSKIHEAHLEDISKVKERKMTGYEYLSKNCDMVLSREDVSRKLVKFVDYFYETYIDEYCNFIENNLHKTVLGIVFSWEDYDKIAFDIINPNYDSFIKNKTKITK